MIFHAIGGLPRSGSTLLCNILNQNPRIYASSTSHVPAVMSALAQVHARSPEVKGAVIRNRDGTFSRIRTAIRGYLEGWYKGREVVFDKSRAWNHSAHLLGWIDPSSKLIVCVRDLRAIYASIERHHRRTAIFDDVQSPIDRTLYRRADIMFSPDGLVGGPLNGIEDLLRRKLPNVRCIRYEDLVADPEGTMGAIYDFLELDSFDHDFHRIENTAEDVDGLYLHKFPHEGCGPLMPDRGSDWRRYVDDDLANTIMSKFRPYNLAFGYMPPKLSATTPTEVPETPFAERQGEDLKEESRDA